jgi:hypothetical protein
MAFKMKLAGALIKMGIPVLKYFKPDLLRRTKIMSHYGIDLLFDVGANIGQYGIMARTLNYKGQIISFEPLNDAFEKLEKASMNDSQWKINHFALGDIATKNTINIAGNSGSSSIQYTYPSIEVLKALAVTSQLLNKGGMVKLWLKSTYPTGPLQPEAIINSKNIRMDEVAQTGEWCLYSARVEPSVFPALNAGFTVQVTYPTRPQENVYIDDARFQPYDAGSKCYVYDLQTFKLLTQFDDQHFGLYYEYNSEGKLIRKQVETERGLKTITETQYNTPKTVPVQ